MDDEAKRQQINEQYQQELAAAAETYNILMDAEIAQCREQTEQRRREYNEWADRVFAAVQQRDADAVIRLVYPAR